MRGKGRTRIKRGSFSLFVLFFLSLVESRWKFCVERSRSELRGRLLPLSCGVGLSFVENTVPRVRVESSRAEVPFRAAREASSSSSAFVELHVLHFVSRPGATHRPSWSWIFGKRHIDGRIDASYHQHVLRSTGGFAGARKGSWRLDPARSCWSPDPDKLKTTRGGEVRIEL